MSNSRPVLLYLNPHMLNKIKENTLFCLSTLISKCIDDSKNKFHKTIIVL